MANYIYDPDTDELVLIDSTKGKLLVEQARLKANSVVQSAGSEMSGGGVSSKPMGAPDINRPNIIEDRIPTAAASGTAEDGAADTQAAADAQAAAVAQAVAAANAAANAQAAELAAQQAITDAKNAAELAAANAALAAARAAADVAARAAADAAAAAAAAAAGGAGITPKTAEQIAAEAIAAGKTAERKSAYNLLYAEFKKYGLGTLVSDIKNYLIDSTFDPSEFSIQLQNTKAYQDRFSANKDRIDKGLSALNPATYIALEDQYQNIMRNYGLPASYYAKDSMGTQSGFNKLIGSDVSSIELEDRIMTAQQRVINSNPEVLASLKQFYPDITNGDILAYTLDPTNALNQIKRKVSAAEIGGAALKQGLETGVARAEQLASYGITKQMAEQGYGTIGGGLQRGSELSSIYGQPAYDQKTAEQEVFNLAGGTEAARERRKLTGLEKATFGGTTGMSSSALSRERAGQY